MSATVKSAACSVSCRLASIAAGLAAAFLAGCVGPEVFAGESPVQIGQIADPRLKELSGIVASRQYAGCFYAHNDSGDAARVYLIAESGATILDIDLAGVRSLDAEDIAIAPGAGAGRFDVCLADIGDNDARRKSVSIYRFPEPTVDPNATRATRVSPTAFVVAYSDGPRNAEAFAVHPTSGDGYIFTKRAEGGSDVYRLPAPWNADAVNVVERVARLDLPARSSLGRIVTGADFSPDGARLVIRCYIDGFVWTFHDVAPSALASQFAAPPQPLSLAIEPQGEAVCFGLDGNAVITVSEGKQPPLHRVSLAGAGGAGD